jgi:hypothetical protein
MIDRAGAIQIALAKGGSFGQVADTSNVRELTNGWFVAWEPSELVGSSGLIVNKDDGACLVLGSAFSIDRDCEFYEKGYRWEVYDLVITAVHDLPGACRILRAVGPTEIDYSYESGTVWRVPRQLSLDELGRRLAATPVVFPNIKLYLKLEVLETAVIGGSFDFVVLKVPDRKGWA